MKIKNVLCVNEGIRVVTCTYAKHDEEWERDIFPSNSKSVVYIRINFVNLLSESETTSRNLLRNLERKC